MRTLPHPEPCDCQACQTRLDQVPHDRRRYKHRDLRVRCRCDVCTKDYASWYREYYRQTRREVSAGLRPSPRWVLAKQKRDHERDRQAAAARCRRRDQAIAELERFLRSLRRELEDRPTPLDLTDDDIVINTKRQVAVLRLRLELAL